MTASSRPFFLSSQTLEAFRLTFHHPSLPLSVFIKLFLLFLSAPNSPCLWGGCVFACVCFDVFTDPAAPSTRDILSSGRSVPRGLRARQENHISSVSLTFLVPQFGFVCFLGFFSAQNRFLLKHSRLFRTSTFLLYFIPAGRSAVIASIIF